MILLTQQHSPSLLLFVIPTFFREDSLEILLKLFDPCPEKKVVKDGGPIVPLAKLHDRQQADRGA